MTSQKEFDEYESDLERKRFLMDGSSAKNSKNYHYWTHLWLPKVASSSKYHSLLQYCQYLRNRLAQSRFYGKGYQQK